MYLNCKTYFSYRYGVLSTEDLVTIGKDVGAQAMALTNINSTANHWPFYTECIKQGIRPLLGVEVRNEDELLYILIAKNINGIQAINAFISPFIQAREKFPSQCPVLQDVFVIYPFPLFDKIQEGDLIGVQPLEVNKLFTANLPLDRCVVLQPVTFHSKHGYNLHRLLRAIDKNIVLSKQEPQQVAAAHEIFATPAWILEKFRRYPQIITNSLRLIDSCCYEI